MTKTMTLRFPGKKQGMTRPAPQGDKVPREVVVTILPGRMTTIAGTIMVSFIAAVEREREI